MSTNQKSQQEGSKRIVSYIHSESLNQVDEQIGSQVERCLLDTVAAATAGHVIDETKIVTEYVDRVFAEGETTVLSGEAQTCSPEGAVLANGIAANALDVDEGHIGADGHPAAIVIPAAIVAAEDQGVTVRELLDAVLVGYETAVRAGLALPSVSGQHTGTGSWGALGAAAAVARLRDASPEATADALSIAEFSAPQTPILRSVATPGSGFTKDGIGWGAYTGYTAAVLAEEGMSGSGTMFDESNTDVLDDLGETYAITDTYYKPYPCCRWIHPGIDAVRDIRAEHEIAPADITEIDVYTFEYGTRLATRTPSSADAAEYSYPFALATSILNEIFTPEHLQQPYLSDEATLDLAQKVELIYDESLEMRYEDAWLARVVIETQNERFASGVTHPRGSTERPMTEREHLDKQKRLLDPYLGAGTAEALRETVQTPSVPVTELLQQWTY